MSDTRMFELKCNKCGCESIVGITVPEYDPESEDVLTPQYGLIGNSGDTAFNHCPACDVTQRGDGYEDEKALEIKEVPMPSSLQVFDDMVVDPPKIGGKAGGVIVEAEWDEPYYIEGDR